MSLEGKFQAFEEAMQQSGGGAIKEAFDALIALLGTTDTALKDEFTVSPSFVDDTATKESAYGYFFIKKTSTITCEKPQTVKVKRLFFMNMS